MTTSTPVSPGRPPADAPARSTGGSPRGFRPPTVIVLLLIAMWVYAFGFAEKKGGARAS